MAGHRPPQGRQAAERLGRAVLVEDTSLELAALGGFPGPLIRWLLEAAGPAVLPRLLADFPDKRAVARCVAVARDGEREWVGVGAVSGVIVAEPRGESGFGWDVVFAPEWGGGRTYAEMPADEKNARSHRALAFADSAARSRPPSSRFAVSSSQFASRHPTRANLDLDLDLDLD